MTTHNVEIRLKTDDHVDPSSRDPDASSWRPLTREPITKRDADGLVSVIDGRYWQARIVSLSSPMGTEFAELERRIWIWRERAASTAVSIRRWERIDLNHHPSCTGGKELWENRAVVANDKFTGLQLINLQTIHRVVEALHKERNVIGARRVSIEESPRVHAGSCSACGAAASAMSISVTIVKPSESGATTVSSSREYAL